MGSGRQEKRSKSGKSLGTKNPSKRKRIPLGPNRPKTKKIKATKVSNSNSNTDTTNHNESTTSSIIPAAADQLSSFLEQYQSANGVRLSLLELESIRDTCIIELSQGPAQSADNLGEHMKAAFGSCWKDLLYQKQLLEEKIEPGNPALLVISLSALRSLELHRGLRPLTRECPAAKLFSKHMKIEEQVSFLKNHVNIACGTPSRIKKLIDMEALALTRLRVIVLDMHTDVKGYSLFSLPQVRDEFWELYKSYFHHRLQQGDLRVCLYGPLPVRPERKNKGSS